MHEQLKGKRNAAHKCQPTSVRGLHLLDVVEDMTMLHPRGNEQSVVEVALIQIKAKEWEDVGVVKGVPGRDLPDECLRGPTG